MPFLPGNKFGRGRPKAYDQVLALTRKRTRENIERLIQLRDQDEDLAVAAKCAIALHEIAWGKPMQQVQQQHDGVIEIRCIGMPNPEVRLLPAATQLAS